MRSKAITATLVLVSGLLLAAKPATAAGDLFLKLPGITGTSTAPGHVGEIPLLSFSAGVSAKKGVGVSCSDLSGMKLVDSSSPLLFLATLAGIDFAQATLTFSQAPPTPPGAPAQDVYTIKMNSASITSVQDSGSSEAPIESLSLHAASWVITYIPFGGGLPVTNTVTCK
jgi:type VI protein secretion system component Hcp